MNETELINESYRKMVNEGESKKALEIARNVVTEIEKSDLGPFDRAEELNEAWFQVACLAEINKNDEIARRAAIEAFNNCATEYSQHHILIRIILNSENKDYREAIRIGKEFINGYRYKFHKEKANLKVIEEQFEEKKGLSKEIKWMCDDILLYKEAIEKENDEKSVNYQKWKEEWEKEGRKKEECDEEIAKLRLIAWKPNECLKEYVNYDFRYFRNPVVFTQIMIKLIGHGLREVSEIKYPETNNLQGWKYSLTLIKKKIKIYERKVVKEESTDKKISELKKLYDKILNISVKAVQSFEKGETKECALSRKVATELYTTYAEHLLNEGEYEDAKDILNRSNEILTTPAALFDLIKCDILNKNYSAIGGTLEELKTNHLHRLRYVDEVIYDTYKLLNSAFCNSLASFYAEYIQYKEKHRKLERITHFLIDYPKLSYPSSFTQYVDCYKESVNLILLGIKFLRKAYPHNLDIVYLFLLNKRYDYINDENRERIEEAESYLEPLRKNVADVHGKTRLFLSLLVLGNIYLNSYKYHKDEHDHIDLVTLGKARKYVEEALETYDQGVIGKFYFSEAAFLRGRILYEDEDFGDGKESLTDAIEILANPRQIIEINLVEIEEGSSDMDFEKMPDYLLERAYYLRAICRQELEEEMEKVLEDFHKCLEVNNTDIEVYNQISRAIYKVRHEATKKQLKEFENSVMYYMKTCKSFEDSDSLDLSIMLANYYIETDNDDAKSYIDLLSKVAGDHPEVQQLQAVWNEQHES